MIFCTIYLFVNGINLRIEIRITKDEIFYLQFLSSYIDNMVAKRLFLIQSDIFITSNTKITPV